MKAKRKRYVILALVMIALTFVAFYEAYSKSDSRIEQFQKEFDLTLPKDTQVIHSESDYGALGDGFCLYIYQLSSQEMKTLLQNNALKSWRPLPLRTPESMLIPKRVASFTSSDMVKKIDFDMQNGFYLFRSSTLPRFPVEPNIPSDAPFPNAIFGMIDTQTNRIYYGTWDM